MEKRGVILFIVSILLVSSAYSVELPWPNNVPFGNAFHENLYVDVIAGANGEDIEVNGTLIVSDDAFISGNVRFVRDVWIGIYDLFGSYGKSYNSNEYLFWRFRRMRSIPPS